MKSLTFSLISPLEYALDARRLNPTYLKTKSLIEINRLPVRYGNTLLCTADIFKISGTDRSKVVLEGSTNMLNQIGQHMAEGTIEVIGNAGAFLGTSMKGGTIKVYGTVGNYLGCSMQGGLIRVDGNAGDFVANGHPGSKQGMANGCIILSGDAGNRLGHRMRRGLVAVRGDVGIGAGSELIAGTILLLGNSATLPGQQMRRGSIICASKPHLQADSFFQQNLQTYGSLKLIQNQLDRCKSRVNLFETLNRPKHRYVGDLCFGGMGEILDFSE